MGKKEIPLGAFRSVIVKSSHSMSGKRFLPFKVLTLTQ
jgi:hypothetical protein